MKFGKNASRRRTYRNSFIAAVSTAVALGVVGTPTQAVSSASEGDRPVIGTEAGESQTRELAYIDARQLSQAATIRAQRAQLRGASRSDVNYLKSLGPQALVDYDELTGTPRFLGRVDGYLSAPSKKPARAVALGYVRSHLSLIGLTGSDLRTLSFRKDYVDSFGVHHLAWTQQVEGTPVFGNGLKVKVTRTGRVLSVLGSPIAGLAGLATKATSGSMSAVAARSPCRHRHGRQGGALARGPAHRRCRSPHHVGQRRLCTAGVVPDQGRPAFRLVDVRRASSGPAAQHVLDASTGAVLFRRSTSQNAEGDALVYDYYPGATKGGKQRVVNLYKKGWLKRSARFLKGSSVIAWSDLNDDNAISDNEKTPVPGKARRAQFKFRSFKTPLSDSCSRKLKCTWDPSTPFSWRKNRKADVTQAFYFASNFHDWLQNGPAKFTTAAGNFSTAGGDPVLLNALDGANTDGGFPDGNHVDNANMDTPPDGVPPTMQMYLFHTPGATDAEDPWLPASSAFDATVLYHEYTHGLSNRLVVDAQGNSTLNSIQAGSMGEAWSDYYAMDYLVKRGLEKDAKKSGDVLTGKYVTANTVGVLRTQPIDCARGANVNPCIALDGTHGGYTYADFPTIGGAPEVHSSGEVWAQTLWDLRGALGPKLALQLITRAMSLSADDPSMLDMRNAILQANLVGNDGKKMSLIWRTFAKRGMGWFAGAIDGADAFPAEDFHVPPPPQTPRTSINGVVTDPTTGDPVAGALVTVAGHGDQFSDVTDAAGEYSIGNLFPGTYPKVVASAPGYFPDVQSVSTASPGPTDFSILRDWAGESGGAEIIDFNGPDYTAFGCGPTGAIDLSLGTGWGSTTGDDDATPTNVFVPKFIVVDMHTSVDISTFGVDPSATCGDPGSASTGDYRIETSVDGTTWVTAAEGTFTAADRGRLNEVIPTAGTTGVRYLRFTILGNQVPDFATNCPDGAFAGCQFTDLTEFAAFGSEVP